MIGLENNRENNEYLPKHPIDMFRQFNMHTFIYKFSKHITRCQKSLIFKEMQLKSMKQYIFYPAK